MRRKPLAPAVIVGLVLHGEILPLIASAAQTGVADSIREVYEPAMLAALGFAGTVVAVAGALVPAGWAAHTSIAMALRAE